MSSNSYGRVAIGLHWLMALGLVANFCLGLSMAGMPLSPNKLRFFSWHKWTGVTLFMLAFLRVLWRMTHPVALLDAPRWERVAAVLAHRLLYVLMILIPLSGWLMSSAKGVPTVYFGMWPLPDLVGRDPQLGEMLETVHKTLNMLMAMLVSLHVVAALKHRFIDRDGVMARMLPFAGPADRSRA